MISKSNYYIYFKNILNIFKSKILKPKTKSLFLISIILNVIVILNDLLFLVILYSYFDDKLKFKYFASWQSQNIWLFYISYGFFFTIIRFLYLYISGLFNYNITLNIFKWYIETLKELSFTGINSINKSRFVVALNQKLDAIVSYSFFPLIIFTSNFIALLLVSASIIFINLKVAGLIPAAIIIYLIAFILTSFFTKSYSIEINKYTNIIGSYFTYMIENIFLFKFNKVGYKSTNLILKDLENLTYKKSIINSTPLLPKYIIEFFIYIFILLAIKNESGISDTISPSTIIMFTLVAFRIMPLLQTMITNLLIIGGTHEYLREIYDLQKLNENLVNNNSIDPINKFNLTIKNLILYNTFLINGSIAFEKNICYKIEGKSGEGKSSLIYTILGLVINEDLKLIINDTTEISRQNIYAYRKKIAWLSQDNYIPNGTVLEFLDTDILQSNQFYLIKLFGIEDLFNEINIENRLGERGCNLSGGQIQKLILLKYLFNIKNYDILILDEATSAIDITTANLIYEYLLNNCTDKIIIVISHQTELNVFKNFIKIYAADFCKPINK